MKSIQSLVLISLLVLTPASQAFADEIACDKVIRERLMLGRLGRQIFSLLNEDKVRSITRVKNAGEDLRLALLYKSPKVKKALEAREDLKKELKGEQEKLAEKDLAETAKTVIGAGNQRCQSRHQDHEGSQQPRASFDPTRPRKPQRFEEGHQGSASGSSVQRRDVQDARN